MVIKRSILLVLNTEFKHILYLKNIKIKIGISVPQTRRPGKEIVYIQKLCKTVQHSIFGLKSRKVLIFESSIKEHFRMEKHFFMISGYKKNIRIKKEILIFSTKKV